MLKNVCLRHHGPCVWFSGFLSIGGEIKTQGLSAANCLFRHTAFIPQPWKPVCDISNGTNAVRYNTQMIMVCHNEMIKNQLKFLQESIQLTVQQLCIFKCVHLNCKAHFIIPVKANEECSNFGVVFYIYLFYYIAKTNTR